MKICNISIENKAILAPMAGITNNAFRDICKSCGAALVCSEMISDAGTLRKNKKTLDMLVFNKKQRPISIQLFGNDSIELSTVAQFVEKNYAPDIIDINCGCPARKVAISKKAGSYLMKEPKKIVEIIKAIKKKTKTPLTIKIRSGWDEKHINAVEIARLAQKAGANAIIVHPRTKTQEFKGHSDWDIIKEVKNAVTIPVIGNGDIKSCYDAKKMLDETGCDAIMIGRAAIGNPWIFKECNDYLNKNTKPKPISLKQRVDMVIKHFKLLKKYDGDKKAILLIRPHIARYFKDIPNHKTITKQLVLENNCDKFLQILQGLNK